MDKAGSGQGVSFEVFFGSAPLPLCLLSRGGRILDANPALVEFLGHSREEICGQHFSRFLLRPRGRERLSLRQFGGRERGAAGFEGVCQGWNGRAIPVHVTVLRQEVAQGPILIVTVQKLASAEGPLEFSRDPLTGLASRELLLDRLRGALTRSRRRGKKAALLLLNLNRFKDINDSLGQRAGNQLLRDVAERLAGCIRASDTLARCHGDRYAILLEEVRDSLSVSRVLRTIFKALSTPFHLMNQEVFLTCGVGIAVFPEDGTAAEEIIKHAETALKRAKEERHNNYQFFTQEMNARVRERLRVESSLYRALEKEEFHLHYQPQVDIETGTLVGVEALLRWPSAENKLHSPTTFISHLEDSRLIEQAGEWILRTACRQVQRWRQSALPELKVGVNISPRQFLDRDFFHVILDVLAETGLAPGALVLEITERLMMRNLAENTRTMEALAEKGVGIAIDDFGTGYSSLSHLKRFPVSTLKIDRSFVQGIPHSGHDRAITCAMVTLGRELHLDVIAEGVENGQQLDFLLSCGCRRIQGFYFARPMPAEELLPWRDRNQLKIAGRQRGG